MKSKLVKNILSFALAGVLCLGLAACGGDNTATTAATEATEATAEATEGTEEAKVLKVGMECGYPPFNWTQLDDSNGGVPIEGTDMFAGGYDVEIAKKIADGLGYELVIVKTEWDGLIPALTTGVIDMVIAGMSPTAERWETIDFTSNYYNSDLVVVVKAGGAYEGATALADFAGAKITAQQNTFHYTVIPQIEGVVQEQAMSDFPAMRVALDSGVIDGYVSEKPEAVSAAAANDSFTFVDFEEGKGFETSPDDTAIAAGVKKGNEEFRDSVSAIIDAISEDERIEIMNTATANQPAAE
ncbi:MAG: transporter substrate-binding domain-containing protein [Firmicutes bacterium]|nr:transporter substrate-binding domain-containing protein [Bacillota bacterium]